MIEKDRKQSTAIPRLFVRLSVYTYKENSYKYMWNRGRISYLLFCNFFEYQIIVDREETTEYFNYSWDYHSVMCNVKKTFLFMLY